MKTSLSSRLAENRALLLKITYAAMCLALSIVLPRLFGAIPGGLGKNLSPLHLTAMLAGLLAGAPFGALVGGLSPLLASFINGAPTLFPNALCMVFECMTYGAVAGLAFRRLEKRVCGIQISLLLSMLSGRIVGGIVKYALLLFGVIPTYPFSVFLTSYFADTLPGAVLQLALIPPITEALKKAGLVSSLRDRSRR